MNVTAPSGKTGRPPGDASLDLLDTLVDGWRTTFGLILETGRERREVVVTLGNLEKRGKVERENGRWTITDAGLAMLRRKPTGVE